MVTLARRNAQDTRHYESRRMSGSILSLTYNTTRITVVFEDGDPPSISDWKKPATKSVAKINLWCYGTEPILTTPS